jgi:protein translocase SecG subunit
MKTGVTIIQILIGIALSGLILLQAKGVGLGRTFGATPYHSRRGMEFVVFRFTIALSVIFVALSMVNQFLI